MKRWARTYDSGQGCCRTMSRYSSASSHTAGLRPSKRAGLCRFPSGKKARQSLGPSPGHSGHYRASYGVGKSGKWSESLVWAPWSRHNSEHHLKQTYRDRPRLRQGTRLTCTHDSLHAGVLDAPLHILQASDVPIGKYRDSHSLPVGGKEA